MLASSEIVLRSHIRKFESPRIAILHDKNAEMRAHRTSRIRRLLRSNLRSRTYSQKKDAHRSGRQNAGLLFGN